MIAQAELRDERLATVLAGLVEVQKGGRRADLERHAAADASGHQAFESGEVVFGSGRWCGCGEAGDGGHVWTVRKFRNDAAARA